MAKPEYASTLLKAVKLSGTRAHQGPFADLIDLAFRKGQEIKEQARIAEKGTLDNEAMYISSFGAECDRQLVLKRRNVEGEPLGIESLMRFSVGHAVENAVAEILGYLGGTVIREQRVEIPADGGVVRGRIDILVDVPATIVKQLGYDETTLPPNNLLEIKATNMRAMIMMLMNNQPGRIPHRKQLNGYLDSSHRGQLPHVYPRGFLIYHVPMQAKGQPSTFVFPVDYDPQDAAEEASRMVKLEKIALQGEELPAIPGMDPKKFPCSYCDYRKLCWR